MFLRGLLMKKRVNWPKACILLFLAIYAAYTFVKQEIEINKYEKEKFMYVEQINLAKQKQEEYKHYSEYVNSDEYIEKIARDKLGMLLPEERIYIEI